MNDWLMHVQTYTYDFMIVIQYESTLYELYDIPNTYVNCSGRYSIKGICQTYSRTFELLDRLFKENSVIQNTLKIFMYL